MYECLSCGEKIRVAEAKVTLQAVAQIAAAVLRGKEVHQITEIVEITGAEGTPQITCPFCGKNKVIGVVRCQICKEWLPIDESKFCPVLGTYAHNICAEELCADCNDICKKLENIKEVSDEI